MVVQPSMTDEIQELDSSFLRIGVEIGNDDEEEEEEDENEEEEEEVSPEM